MSSLKLLHSGGNGVIISAPSSNPSANRTITLNDNYAGDGSFVTANSSGNVGIGTATPAQNLDVTSTDNIAYALDGWALAGKGDSSDILFGGILGSQFDTLKCYTSGSERMRLDSNGNVGIGTSTIADDADHCKLAISGQSGTAAGILIFQDTSNNEDGMIFSDDGNLFIVADRANATSSSSIRFRVDGSSEKMRIDSSGHVLFNCTSLPSSSVAGAGFEKNGSMAILFSSSGSSTSSSNVAEFKNGNGTIGTININGSATSYNTSSDYRLKENAAAISDGITRLKTLKPYRFNFKADASTTVDGFFAHEVTAVPEAITGVKDEVDKDNKPIYQGIDQSKLVPLLTAALQEEVAKREALEARVAALEGA